MTNTLTPVTFHGTTLYAHPNNGKPVVAMRPIIDAIGIDYSSQIHRIKRHPVLKASMVMMTTVAEDGKNRAMVMLPLDKLNGWLFGIDSNRIKKPETKAKVIKYQEECFDVLAQHFGMAKTPYAIAPNQTLSAEQADTLRDLISGHAKTLPKDQQAAFIIKAWSKLKKHFGVSYRQIPHGEYTEALSMIGRHIAEYSIPALPEPQRESVNEQVMRLAKQLTAPNGYGVDAFLPLWVAINRKLERRLRVEHVYELIQWKKH